MQITVTTPGAWTVLRLEGKIDNAGSDELKAALAPHLGGGKSVALDFSGTDYIASVGFRVLMQAYKEVHAAKGRLVLGNMSPALRRFFDIAGLGAVFKIANPLDAVINGAP
ncbi:MAG TPA: STAS domain-containing protein [Opitutaceae bacterium]|jgi:anti-anti-sigma factor